MAHPAAPISPSGGRWKRFLLPVNLRSTASRSGRSPELDFVAKAENIVFIGPTAVGKSGLATGILLKAIENGYRCEFVKAQDLFDEMYASLNSV
jgi:DNA replication protein DnaC